MEINSRKKTLIIGSTGKIGSELVKIFDANKGHQIKLLIRDISKAQPLIKSGHDVIIDDLTNPAVLAAKLKDINQIFLLTSPSQDQVFLQKNVIDAAKRAEINHIVRISALGIHADIETALTKTSLAKWHREIEIYLEDSGIAFTHIRPNFFMQNFLNFKESISNDNEIFSSMTDGKISAIDVKDIAAVSYSILTKTGHTGKAYDITGPESLSFKDMAEQISIAINKKIEHRYVSSEILRGMLLKNNMPPWFIEDKLSFYDGYNNGLGSNVTNTVESITGKKPSRFIEFSNCFISKII